MPFTLNQQSNFSEEQKKGISRVMEIMAAHDGGPDAEDPVKAANTKGWEQAWQEGVTPWAGFRVKPPLAFLMEHPTLGFPKSGKALVPGCGRGDDVVLFAQLGFDATGLDSAPSAVAHSQQCIAQLSEKPPGLIQVLEENFFSWSPTHSGFDVIYDYTFFCAIPPSLRPSWGESMKRVIGPGGFLATLVFPLDGDREDGPPFSVNMEAYRAVLKPEDWDLVLDEIPPDLTTPQKNRTRMVVWRSNKQP